MSTYVQPDNSGSLFKNDKKENDRQPSMRGSAKVNGQEFWVSAWTNTSQKGDKYISFKLEPKEEIQETTDPQAQYRSAPGQAASAPASAPAPAPQDDDIPF
jgi:hypothetical protein